MSIKYDIYLTEHKANTMKAFSWLCKHVIDDEDIVVGLYIQKAARNIKEHDESKYSEEEYNQYDWYFYSEYPEDHLEEFNKAWLHHIHTNPHHWQHWVLINDDAELGNVALEMPYEYVLEMICDWWSFSWKTGNLYEIFDWYEKNKTYIVLHDNTRKEVEAILNDIRNVLDIDKQQIGVYMKIKDIRHIETNETRTDGKYQQRIGCTVEFMIEPMVDDVMFLMYSLDNQGNPKGGYLQTSRIEDIAETDTEFIVTTRNSVYYLEKD